ncbi:hypothetical protein THRCLA_10803 [Thraustotheca clavata]|uniref:Uncharacterized protein n=1 Tax=Thraustotheca clavata TaxID=74557 RepID=A0A1V9YG65_9STRA|nr:hypothetical protein THRCLA_10803 [Thraustotheca clavata]
MKKDGSRLCTVAAYPQRLNSSSDFVFQLSSFLAKSSAVDLISVCVDGISSDVQAVITGAKSFLNDESNVEFMHDPNHAAKALRNAIVGSNLLFVGHLYIDPGLLKIAQVPNHVRYVQDFASDSLVLELLSENTMEKLMDNDGLILTLIHLRMFLTAVNERSLPSAIRITLLCNKEKFYLFKLGKGNLSNIFNWDILIE